MTRYLIRRLLQSLLVLLGASMLVFGILFLTGDPTLLMVSPDATQDEVERVRREMGFDRPVYIQYADYISKVVRGDFGLSIRQRVPVLKLLLETLPATLVLAAAALAIALTVAFTLGLLAAIKRGSVVDSFSMAFALFGQSIPVFFLGIVLLAVFGGTLKWFPILGRGDGSLLDELHHLVLPAVTLATLPIARNTRLIRSSLLETFSQDYIRTARAKGLNERRVVIGHALKNAMIPVITVIGLDFGALLSGAIITETVFAWPGIGRLVIGAINQKDFPVVVGAVTMFALFFVVINLVVDLLYGLLDPRVRYS